MYDIFCHRHPESKVFYLIGIVCNWIINFPVFFHCPLGHQHFVLNLKPTFRRIFSVSVVFHRHPRRCLQQKNFLRSKQFVLSYPFIIWLLTNSWFYRCLTPFLSNVLLFFSAWRNFCINCFLLHITFLFFSTNCEFADRMQISKSI